jgi:uracil-DNA glycosylase
VLGKIAFDAYLAAQEGRGKLRSRTGLSFGHNRLQPLDPPVIASYHPSQQNTSTGRLTESMLLDVFASAHRIAYP